GRPAPGRRNAPAQPDSLRPSIRVYTARASSRSEPLAREEQGEGMAEPPLAVVTDSLAWLPESLAREHGITVVPLHITIGDEHFTEGVDLSTREFFRRLAEARVLPKTSQPAPGEFLTAFRALADGGAPAIVSVNATGKLSGTVRSAETAAGL